MQRMKMLAFGTFLCGTLTTAHAQLSITAIIPTSQTVSPGGIITYQGTLKFTTGGQFASLVSLNSAAFTGLMGDFTATPLLSNFSIATLNTGASVTANLFSLQLSNNPSQAIPHTYSGTVTVNYTRLNNGGSPAILNTAAANFSVQSTPTPPVVLVTLLGGMGTVRMALSRRKKA
jgi:hypothetical protein